MRNNQQHVANGEPAKQFDSVIPGIASLLNERQAARVLGVSPRTLWGLAARGRCRSSELARRQKGTTRTT